jgi:serine/threonine-protein kinase RsbW
MVLAVDEVCANLIIHANKCDPSNKISLIVKVQPDHEIQFLIKHEGDGFDINKYQEPGIDELVSSRRKGGLGLMLVKRIMDEISFTTEKNHNICTLIKHLK